MEHVPRSQSRKGKVASSSRIVTWILGPTKNPGQPQIHIESGFIYVANPILNLRMMGVRGTGVGSRLHNVCLALRSFAFVLCPHLQKWTRFLKARIVQISDGAFSSTSGMLLCRSASFCFAYHWLLKQERLPQYKMEKKRTTLKWFGISRERRSTDGLSIESMK